MSADQTQGGREFKNFREALTFDDVLLVPGYSEVMPAETTSSTCSALNL